MCSSIVFLRATRVFVLTSLVITLFTHPVFSRETSDNSLSGASAPQSFVLRRTLQQIQPNGDDSLDGDLKGSQRLAEAALQRQGIEEAQTAPENEQKEKGVTKKPDEDDLNDVDAQIQEIAKRVGITEEELKQANILQSDTNNAAEVDGRLDHHDMAEKQQSKNDAGREDILDARDKVDQLPPPPEEDVRQPAQAPPEMVAPGQPLLRKVQKPGSIGKPQKPQDDKKGSPDSSIQSEASELTAQLETYKKRLNSLLQSEQEARENERAARIEADELQKKMKSMKKEKKNAEQLVSERNADLAKLRDSLPQIVKEAKDEERGEIEEMKETIEEQKRAFDELFEEKQMLSKMLADEQRKLDELQEKIQHPDLGQWVRQRAERAAILVEGPETDAIKYYASQYMAPKVTKMKHRLQMLENRVEQTVDHLLPAKYGSVVAMLLSIGLVGFPIFVTLSTVVSLTKGVSLRQYVLLGNVFLTAFAVGLGGVGLLLRQDPLQTLYEANGGMFIVLQLCIGVGYPLFLGVLMLTVMRCKDRLDMLVFGCELLFYVVIGMNYRARVWRPAMLGENIDCGTMMYVVYTMDFFAMTALTVASSRSTGVGALGGGVVDIEKGRGVEVGDGSGRADAGSKGIGTLGSNLIQMAVGSKRVEKAE